MRPLLKSPKRKRTVSVLPPWEPGSSPLRRRHQRLGFVAFAVVTAPLLILSLTGCKNGASEEKSATARADVLPDAPAPVEVQPVITGTVVRTAEVTGSLQAARTVSLAPRQQGRVAAVYVGEGDAVQSGQPVVLLDTGDLADAVRSAQAQVASAQAQVAQSEANAAQQRVATRTGIASAIAQVEAAQARLSQIIAGARRQERERAEVQVTIARVNLRKAQADYDRYALLGERGAAAQIEVDQYRAARDVAKAQLADAEQNLSLLREGPTTAEVEQQRQAVRQAEEQLRQARAASAQNAVRQAEIRSARAGLQEKRNALMTAKRALADAVIRAPFAGRVTAKTASVGQIVSPSNALLRIIGSGAVYFEGSVPESEVPRVRVGQAASVTVDALPGQPFAGRVSRIAPTGQTAGRAFRVRIEIVNTSTTRLLRPQMFARGAITVERRAGVTLIPRDAVLPDNTLFVTDKQQAFRTDVILGLPATKPQWVEARGERLVPGTLVIVSGQSNLKQGDKVSVTTPNQMVPASERGESSTSSTGGSAGTERNTGSSAPSGAGL